MAYTPRDWQNAPAGGTPLDAAALDHIEGGVADVHTGIALAQARVAALESLLATYGIARLLWDGTTYPGKPATLAYPEYVGPLAPPQATGSTWTDTSGSDAANITTTDPTVTIIDDPLLTYAGTWAVDTEHRSSSSGSVAGITLIVGAGGGSIDVFANRDVNRGRASVKVDGVQVQTIDEYATGLQTGVLVAAVPLTAGTHTVTITVLGQSSAGATGVRVGIDYLRVTNATITTYAPPSTPNPTPDPTPDPTPVGTGTHGNQMTRYNVGARQGLFAQDTRTQVTSPAVIAGFTHTTGTRVITDTRITGPVRVSGGRLELHNVLIDVPQPTVTYPSQGAGYNGLHVETGGEVVGSEVTVLQRNWLANGMQIKATAGVDLSSLLILGGADGIQIAYTSPGAGNYHWPSSEDPEVSEFTGFSVRLQNFYISDGYVEQDSAGRTIHSDCLQIDGGGGIILKDGNLQAYRIHIPDAPITQRNNDGSDIRSSAIILTQDPAAPRQIEDVMVMRCNVDGGSNTVQLWPTDGALPRRVYFYDCTRGTSEAITGTATAYGIPAAPAGTYVSVDRYGTYLGPGAPGTYFRNFTWFKSGKHIELPHESKPLTITNVVAGADANISTL